MIRLALFDIDGTLISTGGAGQKAFAHVFATQFGIVNGTEHVGFAGRTDPGIVAEVLQRHQVEPSPANLMRFFTAYTVFLTELLPQLNGRILPGVLEWLEQLRALPAPPVLGLLTGNIRQGAEIKLRHFGLWNAFQIGGFSDDSSDRNQIAVAARQRGEAVAGQSLRNDEVLVVGDTPLDIACGRHIGARVLAVATGGSQLAQLQEHHPDWAVPDLRELSVREVCG